MRSLHASVCRFLASATLWVALSLSPIWITIAIFVVVVEYVAEWVVADIKYEYRVLKSKVVSFFADKS